MIHGSLSSLGIVEGGAATLVNALIESAGYEGAVIAPSFRDSIRSDHYALQACSNCCPQNLCPSRERGYTGIIGETVRQLSDSVRSCHPTHSWVGVGKNASYLLSGHRNSLTPCGKDSPFFRLMQNNGQVLLLGVGVNSLTNIHAVEDARNVPYLSAVDPIHRHATYTTNGKRIQYVYPELIQIVLREAGILRSKKIGAGFTHVLWARELGSFLWVVTEDDPWCLVLRPQGDKYEPFEDACSKATRMLSSWNNNPDRGAWEKLLTISNTTGEPNTFKPTDKPSKNCPAYRGMLRGYHRCAANDLPAWEKFDDYPKEPGVATCEQCNWPKYDER
ncbi:MAG: AAC(3) family N-acetyltransferase [Sedimentisphaerales bacterium]|nr:AAC(3) family N-acetyltransferase [Sedimentisphaerales bacterium]